MILYLRMVFIDIGLLIIIHNILQLHVFSHLIQCPQLNSSASTYLLLELVEYNTSLLLFLLFFHSKCRLAILTINIRLYFKLVNDLFLLLLRLRWQSK